MHSLKSEIDRHGTNHEQHAEGSPPGTVDCLESDVLAGPHDDVMSLPEEGVVRANRMRPGGQIRDQRIAEPQHAEWCTVDGYEYLAKADVGCGLTKDREAGIG